MANVLICVELPDQIPQAIKTANGLETTDWKILALTPHVEYALEKLGRDFIRPEDFHTEDEIHEFGLADLARIDDFCDTVDSLLQRKWDLLAKHDLRPASLTWFNLKNFFNSIRIRVFVLRKVLDGQNPSQVLYFGTADEPLARDLAFVHESPWSRVIAMVCQTLEIPLETIASKCDPSVLDRYSKPRGGGLSDRIRVLARLILGPSGIRLLRSTVAKANQIRYRLMLSRAGNGSSQTPFMVTLGGGYSLGLLLEKIKSGSNFKVIGWDEYRFAGSRHNLDSAGGQIGEAPTNGKESSTALRAEGRRFWADAKNMPEFRRMLEYDGIDCSPALERRLEHFFQIGVPETVETYLLAKSLLTSSPQKGLPPRAILAATMGDPKNQAVALAAKQANVPFVVYQHGSTGGYVMMESWPSQIHLHNDLSAADYVLAFGQGDVEYYEKCEGSKARAIPIGSAVLDQIKRTGRCNGSGSLMHRLGLDRKKRTILYAPTAIDGNTRVGPYRSRSPSRAFAIERRILEIFQEFPDFQFIVKIHEVSNNPCSPIVQLVKDTGLKNIITITDPLESVLPLADIFVTDYPSTAFLEMLTTDRPILFCGYELPTPFIPGKWHPSVLDMWKERVAYADGMEEFLELLRSYLREERFQPVESTNTLLKLFGTHLDDGKSVERANDFLASLAR